MTGRCITCSVALVLVAKGFALHSDTLSESCWTPAGQAATASAPFLSATWEKPTLLCPLPNGSEVSLVF